MNFFIAQVMGVIGLIYSIASMYKEDRRTVLILVTITNSFYLLQYSLLQALSGIIITLIAVLRGLIFYYYDSKKKNTPIFILLILITLLTILSIYNYKDIYSLLTLIAGISYTYGVWQNNLRIFRITALIAPVCFIIYNIHVLAYAGALASLIEAIMAIIAIVKIDVLKIHKYDIIKTQEGE